MSGVTYTIEKKAERFDEFMSEYSKFSDYRTNLAAMIISDTETSVEDIRTESGGYLIKQVNKRVSPESVRAIQIEIDRVDTIISFINSILYGDENLQNSKLNNENPAQHDTTRTD